MTTAGLAAPAIIRSTSPTNTGAASSAPHPLAIASDAPPAVTTNSATDSTRTRRPAASKISTEVMTTALRHTTAVVVQDDAGAVRALARLTDEQADDPQLIVLLDHYAAADYLAEAGGKIPAAARQATSDLQAQGDLL